MLTRRLFPCEKGGVKNGYVPSPMSRRRALATGPPLPPVNATRANGGTRGGNDGQHLPDRGQAATSRRRDQATTSARERDTGERRDDGGGDQHLPDSCQAG